MRRDLFETLGEVFDALAEHMYNFGDAYLFIVFVVFCLWAGGAFN